MILERVIVIKNLFCNNPRLFYSNEYFRPYILVKNFLKKFIIVKAFKGMGSRTMILIFNLLRLHHWLASQEEINII